MNILRRFGLTISVLLFSLTISSIAAIIAIYFVFETPDNLKQALSTSGIYSTVAKDTLTQQAAASSALPINDPVIQEALDKALPPQFLQTSSEQAIDGIYKWVKGETAKPEFSIDLGSVKTSFTDNIVTQVQQKLSALPPCAQYSAPPTSLQEVLDLTCLPRGITAETITDNVKREAANSGLFAENTAITADTLKDPQGQPVTDSLAILPELHRYYVISLYVLPLLAILLAVAIIYLSVSKRAGVKKVAWTLITAGLTAVLFAVLGVWALQAGTSLLGVSDSPGIQDKLLAVFTVLAVDLRSWWFGIGAGYTVVGIIMLVVLRFTRPEPTLAMGGTTQNTPPLTTPTLPVAPTPTPTPPTIPPSQNTPPDRQ
jgi:hypothetical protein